MFSGPFLIILKLMDTAAKDRTLNIIMASSIQEETESLIGILDELNPDHKVFCPKSLKEFNQVTLEYNIDLIITDFEYQNGSLVDWLTLWPYPYILLTSPNYWSKLESVMSDETSSFIVRREDLLHIKFVPNMIKKVLNVQQSRAAQNNYIKASEKQYMNLVQALPDIIYVLDNDGNFTFINNAVRNLGWEPVELIGKHFTVLLYEDDVHKVSRDHILPPLRGMVTGNDRAPKLFDERRTGNRMTRGLQLKLKRKPTIGGSISVSLISYGEISSIGYSGFQTEEIDGLGTAGIIREVNSRNGKSDNHIEAESIFNSDGALSHDEVMHLLNNKLQILSSLVSLKQSICSNPLACASLGEVQLQVYTLSLVYQNMVTVEGKVRVNMASYLDDIIKHLVSSYAGNPWIQNIDIRCDAINLDEDSAITVSLFVNELITEFLKIQEALDSTIEPLSITFLMNNDIAQLKLKSSEKMMSIYQGTRDNEGSNIILETLVEIMNGRVFHDKDSVTLFFNID